MHRGREDAAGAGMVDLHVFLHHRRGGADLVADYLAMAGTLQDRVDLVLNEIAFAQIDGTDGIGQSRQMLPRPSGAGHRIGGRGNPVLQS